MGNHALVFGATGIQGWAIVNEILNGYPEPESFDKVTALANRPITDNVLWKKSKKLEVISGIDLLTDKGLDGLESEMRDRIPGVDTVTHMFFFAYIFNPNPDEEISINVQLLQRAVLATESLTKNLKFVLLPTGTKAYGVQMLGDFPFSDKLPLKEDLPRIPEPWQSQNFYYNMCDWLETESKGKEWTWCELRPDLIVGFVPNNNIYCLAQTLATYLACYREIEGEGAECPFPGTDASWKNLSNDSSQDIIARFAIHCALNPKACGNGRAFNIADNSNPSSWSKRWPIVCEYFRLKGTPPLPDGKSPLPGEYLSDHISQWRDIEKKYDLVTGRVGNDRSLPIFRAFVMEWANFDRQIDLSKCHQAWNSGGGTAQQVDSYRAWWTAFQRFREARIIP